MNTSDINLNVLHNLITDKESDFKLRGDGLNFVSKYPSMISFLLNNLDKKDKESSIVINKITSIHLRNIK